MHTAESTTRLLGELERQVMEIIWRRGNAQTVRDVVFELSKKRSIAYTTILTIMNRLVAKGLLNRHEEKQSHTYAAHYSQKEFYSSVAGRMLQKIRNEFGEVAIACFVEEIERANKRKIKNLIRKLNREN